MKYFTDSGIRNGFGVLAIAAEFFGSLGLAVGFLTRIAAFGVACVMLLAIVTVCPKRFLYETGTAIRKARDSNITCLRRTSRSP
jgi:putative oxidoreductase